MNLKVRDAICKILVLINCLGTGVFDVDHQSRTTKFRRKDNREFVQSTVPRPERVYSRPSIFYVSRPLNFGS